ncbi:hypothetical protein DICPUDRAFT_157313 [Dictyostelium purpureum]|uniref:B box-type domain-containing protein n=1 Tax=Dictyostelium purpureum TaxID=5786 RepID=F0ZYT4_DICPU|nr:uncharacterized protein DICPUDRAFT_157313 [Dictyostelium purpureum]EGC30905.1 hypothetical protein DICPUDRAFT_157313 [Dictyostelium purpureum]|eukprot:XP_003292578.1 hypothetical protein DICPUDRAFT_157313 [Dictyostelium purpureum]
MSNNQQYDTKCLDHPHQDIVLICSTCPNNTPVCTSCIIGIHNGHTYKNFEDKNIRDQIQQEFTNQTIPNLNNFLEYNKLILDESNNHFKQIQHNHTNNFDKVFKIFKELKDIINTKENDIKRLLITKLDENKDKNNIITTTIEDNINKINKAIKYNNVNNNNDSNINNNDFIELLKHNYQCINLILNINKNYLPEYNDTHIIIKENNNIDSIRYLTNSYLEMVDDIPLVKKDLKTLEYGFYQPLNFIPPTVQYLYLGNIKYQLTPDSIPATVTHLFLQNGFNQPLNFIPPTVKYLYLHNIKYQLKPGSIPATVTDLILHDGFNQPLNFIPPTLKLLLLKNIKYQLIPGSIPNHLTSLTFDNGFSQRFTKGIIPDSIPYIYIGDVVYPLEPDSILNPDQRIEMQKWLEEKNTCLYGLVAVYVLEQSQIDYISGLLLAFAGGYFLLVGFFEIMVEEFSSHSHTNEGPKSGVIMKIKKLSLLLAGFTFMAVLAKFV